MTPAEAPLDYGRFEALTFDCYGTLIDWETGLTEAFDRVFRAHGIEADAEEVLARYARHEAAAEAGPYLRYRDVLARGLRGVAAELGFEPTADEQATFGGSVADWPAFPPQGAVPPRRDHELRR
jgi:2-haloacid dehalogenase